MSRALVIAPAGVDLPARLAEEYADAPPELLARVMDIVEIPGATNGTLQAWDTMHADLWSWLGTRYDQLTVYTRRRDVPAAVLAYLLQVQRSDSRTAAVNVRWVRYADLQSTPYDWTDPETGDVIQVRDWFRVRGTDGSIRVDVKANMTAGERPVDWAPIHEWLGVADELGEM